MVLGEHKTLKIYLHSTLEGTRCHRCGQPIDHAYGQGQEIKPRHLPLGEYNIVLFLRPKRYQCRSCEGRPTTSQTVEVARRHLCCLVKRCSMVVLRFGSIRREVFAEAKC
ncbi:transposase family protein [Lamprobacter modestohalophilus]|uniref:transposase family protein n=1 Tax=Lamprobacter modestohalophilus TaxID=1064514 RepID=UPI003D1894CD